MERRALVGISGPAPRTGKPRLRQARRPWTREDDQALSDAGRGGALGVCISRRRRDRRRAHRLGRVAHAVEQATGHRRTGAELHARYARLPPAPPQYVERISRAGRGGRLPPRAAAAGESRHSVPTAACEPVKRKKRGVLASMKAAHRFLFRRREKTKPRVVAVRCPDSLLYSRRRGGSRTGGFGVG